MSSGKNTYDAIDLGVFEDSFSVFVIERDASEEKLFLRAYNDSDISLLLELENSKSLFKIISLDLSSIVTNFVYLKNEKYHLALEKGTIYETENEIAYSRIEMFLGEKLLIELIEFNTTEIFKVILIVEDN